ncbi:MAG: bifunctional 5,10-methylene-tetrahydrofolate dehydrogenase/5,10-methylene-tetrahydrofolate cyclohydrolase [Eggerthellaceae bacterium]|nr:bifunctional 5,10-methylene-tetrahydrofolate dehydrogenase/5,10-methylene-tetrahydrofolate cyclohydrolase [Eggerthellaceae bacterium]
MAKVLSGKDVENSLKKDIEDRIEELHSMDVSPKLAVVRLGERPDDVSYCRMLFKKADELGILTDLFSFSERSSTTDLSYSIQEINEDREIHGCIIMRPLPKQINDQQICNILDPAKDVDGITPFSLAGIFADTGVGFAPSTAEACMDMLDHYNIPLEGKNVVVVGRSLVVGKPVSMLLLARHATVTLCHSRTKDLCEHTKGADIVICATGRPKAFGPEYFREGQIVLDVGLNVDDTGKLCGDVDFNVVDEALGPEGAISKVPGGIGLVTTMVTVRHVVEAAKYLDKDWF